MNFELSEEQKMIQQSVERFVQENYDLPKRVEISSKDPGYSKDYWGSMAELGWLGLPFNFSMEDSGPNSSPAAALAKLLSSVYSVAIRSISNSATLDL